MFKTKKYVRLDYRLPILYIPPHFSQCISPRLHHFYVLLKLFFMFNKGLSKDSRLVPYIRWIHIVKSWQNCHSFLFHTFNDLCKFLQTTSRSCKVFERMTIANFDFSIALNSSTNIDFPLSRFSSSLKVTTPFFFKAAYSWPMKLL